jgi:hypothetical protein
MAQELLVGQGLVTVEASHSDRPHSMGLLWTSDRPDAETSTWQHSQQTGIHAPDEIWTHNPSKLGAADTRLRRRGHRDRRKL